ncbi:MAG TPA: hypothetical protein VFM94_10820, partial [Solirubrobacterales bacterium]|nr:hypothetical protein [Solirubrobacterales bacterium]
MSRRAGPKARSAAAGPRRSRIGCAGARRDNWRWSGVPFFIRAGKAAGHGHGGAGFFKTTPWLGFVPNHAPRPESNQLVLRISPTPGARLRLQAKDAEKLVLRPVQLGMTFASMEGEGAIAYEMLLQAAMVGDPSHFARQDALEETWRVVQPPIDAPPPVEVYKKGTRGPESADKLVREHAGWHDPW